MKIYYQKRIIIKTFGCRLVGQDPETVRIPEPDLLVKGTDPRIRIRIYIKVCRECFHLVQAAGSR
jgi:hypothetical protein